MSLTDEKEAIRELFSEYCFRMDDGLYRDVAELFTEDGEWTASYSHARGREEIAAMLARNIPPRQSGVTRKHFVLNSLIRVAGNTATARASYLVFVGRGGGPEPVVAGTYDDDLVKGEEGWRFRRRRLVHDIAGELGLNLPPQLPGDSR
jgi:3-phenylpropionate/cinnamic acid dioxygenase small subunit